MGLMNINSGMLFGPLIAGKNVLNKEYQRVDLMEIDYRDTHEDSEINLPYFFGSDNTKTDIINAPYSDGPFYGFRQVLISRRPGNYVHFVTVIVIETYPLTGRIFANTYDVNSHTWYGWKFSQMQG